MSGKVILAGFRENSEVVQKADLFCTDVITQQTLSDVFITYDIRPTLIDRIILSQGAFNVKDLVTDFEKLKEYYKSKWQQKEIGVIILSNNLKFSNTINKVFSDCEHIVCRYFTTLHMSSLKEILTSHLEFLVDTYKVILEDEEQINEEKEDEAESNITVAKALTGDQNYHENTQENNSDEESSLNSNETSDEKEPDGFDLFSIPVNMDFSDNKNKTEKLAPVENTEDEKLSSEKDSLEFEIEDKQSELDISNIDYEDISNLYEEHVEFNNPIQDNDIQEEKALSFETESNPVKDITDAPKDISIGTKEIFPLDIDNENGDIEDNEDIETKSDERFESKKFKGNFKIFDSNNPTFVGNRIKSQIEIDTVIEEQRGKTEVDKKIDKLLIKKQKQNDSCTKTDTIKTEALKFKTKTSANKFRRIIIFTGRQGAGVSTTALKYAYYISIRQNNQVLFVDCDWKSSDTAVALGLLGMTSFNERNMSALLAEDTQVAVKACATSIIEGLDILSHKMYKDLSEEEINRVWLSILREDSYETVIVDLPFRYLKLVNEAVIYTSDIYYVIEHGEQGAIKAISELENLDFEESFQDVLMSKIKFILTKCKETHKKFNLKKFLENSISGKYNYDTIPVVAEFAYQEWDYTVKELLSKKTNKDFENMAKIVENI